MAPTKKDAEKGEKEAKLTPEQSSSLILDYLRKQNRPYSATDVSANLKNRVTKAAAAKLLKDMHERNEIEGRASGKQWVYHTIQEEPDEAASEHLQALDVETSRLKDATVDLKNEEKDLRIAIRSNSASVPLPALKASIEASTQQKNGMLDRLHSLKNGDVQPVKLEDREKVDRERRKWERIANARQKIRRELWQEIESQIEKDQAAELKEAWDLNF